MKQISTDPYFLITAALAGAILAIIAEIAPYVAAVLLVVGP
jgi:hypothetical protein